MNFLITGGSGLLGSRLSEIAVSEGHDVYSGYNDHEVAHGIPIKLNICEKMNVTHVFDKLKPEVLVHCAALTHVDRCEENPEKAKLVNVQGTKNIVDACEKQGVPIVYVSTDYVFPGDMGLYEENDETNPINVYGRTKLEGEIVVASSELNWSIVRPSVIYGASPAAGKENFSLWVIKKLKKREKINVITDQIISPTLNTNLANMILEILDRKLTGLYHLSGSTQINRYDFSMSIARIFELDESLITPAKTEDMNWLAKRPSNSSLNVRKALKILKRKPLDLENSLITLKEELKK